MEWWKAPRLLTFGVFAVSALAGLSAGIAGAALGLALIGKSIEALTVEQAETLLVVGPLAGLLPIAGLLMTAQRVRLVARWLAPALGLWLACAAASFAWLGLSPVFR